MKHYVTMLFLALLFLLPASGLTAVQLPAKNLRTHNMVDALVAAGIVPRNRYGLKWDKADNRDLKYARATSVPAVEHYDLSTLNTQISNIPIYDQGMLGSCTAQGGTYAIRHAAYLAGKDLPELSKLALYYFERVEQGTVMFDSGASIRDIIRAATKYGVAPEKLWTYSDGPVKFRLDPRYSKKITKALTQKVNLVYRSVPVDEGSIKKAILETKCPVIIGMDIFSGFESLDTARTGIVPMPTAGEPALGGHCMVIVGWKNINGVKYFKVRNSWSAQWGDKGYCYIPVAYLTDRRYCADYWLIQVTK